MASNKTLGKFLGEWGRGKALYVAMAAAVGILLVMAVYPLL